MALLDLRNGLVGIATGLRIPLNDARLDRLMSAVVRHAKQRERNGGFVDAEDAATQCKGQDDALYEATERVRREVADSERNHRFVSPLLEAVHAHHEWRHLPHAFSDLRDFARQHRERDIALYARAAIVRSEAARSGGAGVHLDAKSAGAVLRGEATVARMPVEFTRGGKCVPAHYKVGGGDGGSYALLTSPRSSAAECMAVHDHRLRVVSVEMQRFGDLDEDEARLEGSGSRTDRLDSWWQRHGHYLFEWRVWRYELAPVEHAEGSSR